MDIKTAKEVIACLPEGKTKFNYYKDKYAIFILSQAIGKECRLSDLKQSAYSSLLNKPAIKKLIAQSGDGVLHKHQLDMVWDNSFQPFLLTLNTWGHNDRGWDQVSRRGHNIVLQLNFSNKHDKLFKKLLNPIDDHCFHYWGHPILTKGSGNLFRETLAWARIDFDYTTNEALIEELQTDWLRVAKQYLKQIENGRKYFYSFGPNTTPEKIKIYLEKVLVDYGKIWDEAMLTASIQFIRQELGINTVYIHSAVSGAAIKKIKYTHPPRSLYTKLPRKFCFTKTKQAPEFLQQCRAFRKLEKKLGGTQWNVIRFGKNHVITN